MQAVDHGYGVDRLVLVIEAANRVDDLLVGGYVEIGRAETVEHVVRGCGGTQQRPDYRLFSFGAVGRYRQTPPLWIVERLGWLGLSICQSHLRVLPSIRRCCRCCCGLVWSGVVAAEPPDQGR